jgi:probable O-glycosylation ligase (exosortase A-associated)
VGIRTAILLAFFVASVPVCFVRPFYGILLWTIVAFLNPQSFVWTASYSFPWAAAVAIPTLAGFLFFCRGWMHRVSSRELFLIVALWVWFTITSVASTNAPMFMRHAQDTWDRWELVSKILLMTLVIMAVVDSFARLRILVMVIAGCFGFFVLKALPFMILTGGGERLYGPENSMIADNNDLGLALNMTLPLLFFLAQTESRPWVKRLFGLLFVITIPAIFFTYSRGALVGLTVVLLLMFLQLRQRLVLVPVIVIAIAIAMLAAPERWKERMDPTREGAVDSSARSRLNAWTFCWNLVSDFPIAGGGFATFTPELFDRYAPNPKDVHGPHSVYFGVLAEHGFVGLFLYLALAGSCLASTHRLVKLARFHGDQFVVNYANMFRFSEVGFLTSGVFLGRAYFDYFFAIVACTVILKKVCLAEWGETLTDEPVHQEALA